MLSHDSSVSVVLSTGIKGAIAASKSASDTICGVHKRAPTLISTAGVVSDLNTGTVTRACHDSDNNTSIHVTKK